MEHVRRDLGQRFEHEAALMHRGMRYRQACFVDDQAPKKQNVDVDDTGTFFLRSPTPQLALDAENACEQLLRTLLCAYDDGAIQKPGLRSEFHRLGFVER